MVGVGRPVYLRRGPDTLETVDTIRLGHVLEFARGTGKEWPTIEWLAAHPEGNEAVDSEALVDECQRLTVQHRPPEHLAPVVGNLRNDAVRIARMAGDIADS
jgi:hypothetical protein